MSLPCLKELRFLSGLVLLFITLFCLISCSDSDQDLSTPDTSIGEINKDIESEQSIENKDNSEATGLSENIEPTVVTESKTDKNIDYQLLRQKITYAKAEYSDVLQSLTETDVGGLTNTVHALYSMRWHRKVLHLLDDLWLINYEPYPAGIAWKLFQKPPVRIALASTIFRIKSDKPLEHGDLHIYKEYIRNHKYDEHEFNRAQVVVALGLAGDPADVPYLEEMASADNHYVTQSAITGLGLMNNKQASDALVELYKKYRNDGRSDLILEMLEKAYDLHLVTKSPDEGPDKS